MDPSLQNTSPEVASLFDFLLVGGPLCFPLTEENTEFFAGVLIPAKIL